MNIDCNCLVGQILSHAIKVRILDRLGALLTKSPLKDHAL